MDLKSKVELAVSELSTLRERPVTVLYSGGKDSTASLLLVFLAGLKYVRVLYVEVTGNTDALCNEYVRRVVELFESEFEPRAKIVFKHVRRHDIDFYSYMLRSGVPPPIKSRWCYTAFKWRFFTQVDTRYVIVGIKASDSVQRSKTLPVERHGGYILLKPIFNFTTEEVIDLLREYGIPLNPCYEIFGHSGNCMFCPFADTTWILKTLRYKTWRNRIVNTLLKAQAKEKPSKEVKKKWLKHALKYITDSRLREEIEQELEKLEKRQGQKKILDYLKN